MTTVSALRADTFDPARSDAALAHLLRLLTARNYRFVAPTPETHARVLARDPGRSARDLRDVLGWGLPFRPEAVGGDLFDTLGAAGALAPGGDGRFRCRYRVSSLEGELFLHSAYPTDAKDAVFLGPDSYRFARLIGSELSLRPARPGQHLVDIGAGAGVGGVVAGQLCPGLRLSLTDINPEALRLAEINAGVAGLSVEAGCGPDLDAVEGGIDVALANPPYIIDEAGRDYRDGGEMHGAGAALRMAAAAVARLNPGGRLILYTGSPIVDGSDPLRCALENLALSHGCDFRYWEIDPDVFGEELERAVYRTVERIAVVAAVVSR